MPSSDDEPTLAVAHGDRALARHLRQSLEVLRDRSGNEDFRSLVDDVLHGRADLREAYAGPLFAAELNPHVEQFARRFDELSDEERAEMAERGREALAEERQRLEADD